MWPVIYRAKVKALKDLLTASNFVHTDVHGHKFKRVKIVLSDINSLMPSDMRLKGILYTDA